MKNSFKYFFTLIFLGLSFFSIKINSTLAKELYPEVTPSPDIWSNESQLVFIYAYEYGAKKKTVSTLGRYALNDDDVPLCLYIGRKRRYNPYDVLGMKKRGLSWNQIFKTVGIKIEDLYKEAYLIGVRGRIPPRFCHIMAEYEHWLRTADKIDLSDDEIRDLVLLGFVVRKSGIPPINVMRMRNSGSSWVSIILSSKL